MASSLILAFIAATAVTSTFAAPSAPQSQGITIKLARHQLVDGAQASNYKRRLALGPSSEPLKDYYKGTDLQ